MVKTVNNRVIPLKKGYMIVKCRGQQDINDKLTLAKALEKERKFFVENLHYRQELFCCMSFLGLFRKHTIFFI